MTIRWPRGIRSVVEKYADRIEQATGEPVQWDKVLGCGSFGCVYPASKGRVLKISTDPTEGPVVAAIIKTGLDKKLDGLVPWFGVWRIPEVIQAGPRGTGWVIVREDIEPLDRNNMPAVPGRSFQMWPSWFSSLRVYNQRAHKAVTLKTKWRAERALEDAQEFLSQLYNHEETYFVAQAIEELARLDIVLADVHPGNLGVRTNWSGDREYQENVRWYDGKDRPPLLIFDPGHSSAPENVTVPELWSSAVSVNPGILDDAEGIEEI